jgi:O-succinylbenzoic acid--CoA ligase
MDALSVYHASREPRANERIALIAEGEAVSFRALGERVASVRNALEARGIGPSSRIALLAGNTLPTVLALFAAIELGATLVLLHPRLTAAEVALLVADAAPALLLRDDDLRALASVDPPPALVAPPTLDPEHALAMVYTSGTTGRPKGAVLSRRAFVASAEASAQNLGFTEDDRWLLCLPLCHVGGLSILTRCLLARRPFILEPRFDPEAVLASIARHRATLLSVVPTMLRSLLEHDQRGVLSSLRVVLCGGAATPFSLVEASLRRAVPVLTTYGLTEACSQVTCQRLSSLARPEPGSGNPLPGVELRVVGASGEEPGSIEVRGPTLMSGYWRGEGLPLDPRRNEAGWFETGDLGTLDAQGRLRVHARRGDLIITGGENVYPLEVEQTLESLPGVRAALVFGVPDPRWGQIVAMALEAQNALDLGLIAASLRERLAPHKWPRRFVVVDELPRKGPGKLDRAFAAERYAEALLVTPFG